MERLDIRASEAGLDVDALVCAGRALQVQGAEAAAAMALRWLGPWAISQIRGCRMKIRGGYELIYDFPQPTPIIMVLGTHFTRRANAQPHRHCRWLPVSAH